MAAKKKTEETKQEAKTWKGKVTGGALYIRKEPSTDAATVGVLEDGTQIEILETLEGWYKIKGGYIMSKWVKLDA